MYLSDNVANGEQVDFLKSVTGFQQTTAGATILYNPSKFQFLGQSSIYLSTNQFGDYTAGVAELYHKALRINMVVYNLHLDPFDPAKRRVGSDKGTLKLIQCVKA
jgi:hypothetical protein